MLTAVAGGSLLLGACGAQTASPVASATPTEASPAATDGSTTSTPTVEPTGPDRTPTGSPKALPTSSEVPPTTELNEDGLRPAPVQPGPGWTLVTMRVGGQVADTDPAEIGTRLLLVSPEGERHELGFWSDERGGPGLLVDWTEDGSRALFLASLRDGTGYETSQWWAVDLTTAEVTRIPRHEFAWAGLTRPTGRNLVERRDSVGGGGGELVRVSPAGTVLATLASFSAGEDFVGEPAWLYGPDGTTVVVGGRGSFAVVGNDGGLRQALDDADQKACFPVRWWDDRTVLARCVIADGGENVLYHRLWLVPTDGADAVPLTAPPAEPPIVVDFGHVDALAVDGRVFAQWSGDCGAAAVVEVAADGTTSTLPIEAGEGTYLLGEHDGRLIVHATSDCGGGGDLVSVALDGTDLIPLLEATFDDWGVDGAITLR